MFVIRDEVNKDVETENGNSTEYLENSAHLVMTFGLFCLLIGLVTFVWRDQNRRLGIAMVVMGSVAFIILVIIAS